VARKTTVAAALDVAAENFRKGHIALRAHPLFAPLTAGAYIIRQKDNLCPDGAWAVVSADGQIHVHPRRRGQPEEWVYVLAHCLLHLGLGQFREHQRPLEWNAACDVAVMRFLAALKLGRAPEGFIPIEDPAVRDEELLYERFCRLGLPPGYSPDMRLAEPPASRGTRRIDWQAALANGVSAAVMSAVNVAGGREAYLGARRKIGTVAVRAREWFINSYPLLGALAVTFRLVEDAAVCRRLGISVAAVDAESQEIFVNPAAALTEGECRFVIAHELLHVGLRHDARRQGRDPFFWNLACDYVINGWLVEMRVGDLPKIGVLYDAALKGESSETIYDQITTDVRRYRKLATLRGQGLGDMLERGDHSWWNAGEGVGLDELYRRYLGQGLAYHETEGRGFLPAGLIEEIRALSQPPIQWDVELAQWFDHHFPPLERLRSYARPSRRQSSTPDIPRPRYVPDAAAAAARTFAVLLDTSGSMDRTLLAKALGAIASYSLSRDVPAVRVVFCDAVTYDQGYMPPESIAGSVQIRGRGGTILQPGVDLIERATDFPKEGPMLVITDGACDRLLIRREHAFLLPAGRSLPFLPKGPVFKLK